MNTRSIGFRLIFWYAGLLTGVFLLIALAMHAGVKNFLDFSMSEVATRRAYQHLGYSPPRGTTGTLF